MIYLLLLYEYEIKILRYLLFIQDDFSNKIQLDSLSAKIIYFPSMLAK